MYVLVVDDDPMICKTAEFLLAEEGYDVGVAFSGEAAAEMVETHQPDLIVLDLVLPDVNGFEIYKRLHDASVDAKILLLTPEGWQHSCVIGLELNTGSFLEKPFLPEDFTAAVNTLAWRLLKVDQGVTRDRVRVGNAELRVDESRLILTSGNVSSIVCLAPAEVNLLRLLMVNAGTLVPAQLLRSSVDGNASRGAEGRSVDARIGRLLRKIAAAAPDPLRLEITETKGYRFSAI